MWWKLLGQAWVVGMHGSEFWCGVTWSVTAPTPPTPGPRLTSTSPNSVPLAPPNWYSRSPKTLSQHSPPLGDPQPPPAVPAAPSGPWYSLSLWPSSGSADGPLPLTAKSCAEANWLLRLLPTVLVGDSFPSPTPGPWQSGLPLTGLCTVL